MSHEMTELTADDVRDLIERHSMYVIGNNRRFHNGAYEDIADELNVTPWRGTCEWILEHSGTLYDKWRCSKCGYLYVESRVDHGIKDDFDPNYCPKCGCEVER